MARGAESICFFQWRASRSGAEKFHSALLPHSGTAGTGWTQSLELSALLDSLSPVVGLRVQASAAMVFSWEAWWSAEGETQPSSLLQYLPEAHRYHRALRALGVTVDLVSPDADLAGYDLVILPTLYTVTDATAHRIADAAHSGAVVLVTPFSGIVDENDTIRGGGYPGAFRELLGLTIDEFRPLGAHEIVRLTSGARGSIWSEIGRVADTEVIATFVDGPAQDSPALTRRAAGAGAAWYAATVLDDEGLLSLFRRLCSDAGVPFVEAGPDVDIVTRRSAEHDFIFIINHRTAPITLPYGGLDLVSGATVAASNPVPAGAVRVVMTERNDRGA